jgi:hypothetical protein
MHALLILKVIFNLFIAIFFENVKYTDTQNNFVCYFEIYLKKKVLKIYTYLNIFLNTILLPVVVGFWKLFFV